MSEISRRNLVTAGSGLALAGAIGLVRPASAQMMGGTTVASDGYTYMLQDPRLSVWVQLINAGGVENAARTAYYTVFPAADSAFAQFPGLVQSLVGYLGNTGTHNAAAAFPDTSRIVRLLRSHVVQGKHFTSEMMSKRTTLTSVAGTPITFDATDPAAVKITWQSLAGQGQLTATLAEPPVTTVNAVIYVLTSIDKM